MSKSKNKLLLLLLLLTALSGTVSAQVTIGSGIEPVKGALLDLKQTQTNDGSANSAFGIMLPRVLLTELDKLSGGNGAITGVTESQQDKDTHTGLTVYNVGDCPGVYVWSGTLWEKLGEPCSPVVNYTLTATPASLTLPETGGNQDFTVFTDVPGGWVVDKITDKDGNVITASWLTLGTESGVDNADTPVTATAVSNSGGNLRRAYVHLKAGELTTVVVVEQTGYYSPPTPVQWAGSNVYYSTELGHLTFEEGNNSETEYYQGVFFYWGSLYGVSPTGSTAADVLLFPPDGGSGTVSSYGYALMGWPRLTNGEGNNDESRAYLYEKTDATAGVGDICKHLTDKGWAPKGARWRMPTAAEYNFMGTWSREPDEDFRGPGIALSPYGVTKMVTGIRTGTSHTSFLPYSGLLFNFYVPEVYWAAGAYWASSWAHNGAGQASLLSVSGGGTEIALEWCEVGFGEENRLLFPIRCVKE